MVVTHIYVVRHGFRTSWTVNARGQYSSLTPSPTGIAGDVPLAAHGVRQSNELALALTRINHPPITRIYSSPFYRCLQTLRPFAEMSGLEVKGDNGLGEWFGVAEFQHPSPANASVLNALFPWYSRDYESSIVPSSYGETLPELHDRCAHALQHVIAQVDAEDAAAIGGMKGTSYGEDPSQKKSAILICTHAASLIAIGRALTGQMPVHVSDEDFKTYTCGISKFERRTVTSMNFERAAQERARMSVPPLNERTRKGIAGGWRCVNNCDCSHLESGEERGWHFQGDEAFGQASAAIAKL